MTTEIDYDLLVKKAHDILIDIEAEIGETVGLARMDAENKKGVVLAEAPGTSGFCYHLEIGYLIPIHTAAPCKAMLAYMPASEVNLYLENAIFTKHTASTITTPEGYIEELKSVRKKGYSIDISEEIEGCHCVGVPVLDANNKPIAAIWTTGISGKLPIRSFDKISRILKKGSKELSRRLHSKGKKLSKEFSKTVINRSIEYMSSNLDILIDLQDLADKNNVSYSWFRKAFKEQTGSSPNQYHLTLRIEKAKELLQFSERSIKEIADTLGFQTQNHFSALFKRKVGISPDNFRKTNIQDITP